jgi:hypothetical protein
VCSQCDCSFSESNLLAEHTLNFHFNGKKWKHPWPFHDLCSRAWPQNVFTLRYS